MRTTNSMSSRKKSNVEMLESSTVSSVADVFDPQRIATQLCKKKNAKWRELTRQKKPTGPILNVHKTTAVKGLIQIF